MKKIVTLFTAFLILVIIDFVLSRSSIPVNERGYLMGYKNFHDHALQTKGQKRIILLGGSSLGWGVSAKDLTEKLGVLTLNAGIHADVGYRGFFYNAKDVLDKGHDIIIISPEHSLPSGDSVWSRSKEYCEIALFVLGQYPVKCIGYSLTKLSKIFPVRDQKSGDYFFSGFNNFGDYIFRQKGVDMVGKIKENESCKKIIIDDLVNQYVPFYRDLKSEGYRIFYVPNFVSNTGCRSERLLEAFHRIMFDEFGIPGFKESKQIYDEKYFYNTGYHLTNEGVSLKTEIFARHLQVLLTQRTFQ